MLAKTGAERSVDDFVSLRTAMKYYDNLAKRKRRLKKKVKVPLVVIFLLIFYSCSGTVCLEEDLEQICEPLNSCLAQRGRSTAHTVPEQE